MLGTPYCHCCLTIRPKKALHKTFNKNYPLFYIRKVQYARFWIFQV